MEGRPGGSPFEGRAGAGDRSSKGAQPKSLQDFLGVEKGSAPREGQPAREHSGDWAKGSLAAYGTGAQPFTAEWYKDHPNAFQAQYPHADAFAASSRNDLNAFLAVPVGTTGVYTSTTTSGTEAVAEPTTEEVGELAAHGDQPVADDSEWMQIGVYALLQGNQTDAARMIQLAVNKDGVLRGSHYDLLSDETQTIQGAIDKKTQLAAWTIGEAGQVVFQSTLDGLTQEKSKATAYFPNGKSGSWLLAQAKN